MNKTLVTNQLPKFFVITVEFIDGTKEEFKCAERVISNDNIEVLTTDNLYIQLTRSNVKSIKFDKNYSKLIEHAIKKKRENSEKQVVKKEA